MKTADQSRSCENCNSAKNQTISESLMLKCLENKSLTFCNLLRERFAKGKNTNEFYLKVFGKLKSLMQTAWKSDSYF